MVYCTGPYNAVPYYTCIYNAFMLYYTVLDYNDIVV